MSCKHTRDNVPLQSAAHCPEQNTVTVGNVRIQVITDQLIRFEWHEHGIFEDRQTLSVINRDAGTVEIAIANDGTEYSVRTGKVVIRLVADGKELCADNLAVEFLLNGAPVVWRPGLQDPQNLGATIRTLDGINGDLKRVETIIDTPHGLDGPIAIMQPVNLGQGFLSRSGWSVIDDAQSVAIDWQEGRRWIAPRPKGRRQDFYLFAYGHDYRAALSGAARVFGAQPLPPRYTLGYWWSRYWAYSDEEIEDLVRSFDRMGIPLDVVVLDMDWHLEGWTGYTWDRRYFPDPDEHLRWLKKQGISVTLNLHPADGVGRHEEQFPDMAVAMGLSPAQTDRIQFSIVDQRYMDAYFKFLHHPEERRGVDFWWMDWQQGESTQMPGLDTLPWINQLHWEDMERRTQTTGKRPLIFSRYGGFGAGRYAIGFSGDTFSNWNSLAFQPHFTATASNVLYGYWSHDIGGHMPGEIEPELYTRWMQYGAYSPILRTHTSKNVSAERRVWEYPAPYADIMRGVIRKRYEMVPYLYTENRKAHDSGISLCRPMYYDYPEIAEAYESKNQYMLGDAFLVAPVVGVLQKSTQLASVAVWLPEREWLDTARGVRMRGGERITRNYLLEETPVFVRPGAIVPGQICPSRLKDACYENLLITVYAGNTGAYSLYEDDGISSGYLEQEYAFTRFSHGFDGNVRVVTVHPTEGRFHGFSPARTLTVKIEGTAPAAAVAIGGRPLPYVYRLDDVEAGWCYRATEGALLIKAGMIDLTCKNELSVTYQPDLLDTPLIDGLRGMFARFRAANRINKTLLQGRILHPQERIGQHICHAANRIARKPESFIAEVEQIRLLVPEWIAVLDAVGRSSGIRGWPDNERIARSQVAINLLQDSLLK